VSAERVRHTLFLDRDGTIVREPHDFRVDDLTKVDFLPFVAESLAELYRLGFRFVLVSNQDGLGTPDFPYTRFDRPHRFILTYLEWRGVPFEAVLIDYHKPEDHHPDRKPNPGLVRRWLAGRDLDPATCWVIGDRRTDAWLAHNLGIGSLTIRDPLSADGDQRSPDVPPVSTVPFSDWPAIVEYLRPHAPGQSA
jgi:imidazoleglycerol-phosphate dehydratase/histidinol-phosphatase